MYALTFVTALLVCLSGVSSSPPTILAYKVGRGEPTAGARLLDCIVDIDGNIRCRPLRQRVHNVVPGPSPGEEGVVAQNGVTESVAESVEGVATTPERALEVDQLAMEPNFIKVFDQGSSGRPRCEPYEIYIPELDRCVDVIEHLKAPRMTDPRVSRWYSWRNSIIDARLRSRGY